METHLLPGQLFRGPASEPPQPQGSRPPRDGTGVALAFGKEHKNVLADIRNTIDKCEESFTGLNFQLSGYEDSTGRKLPMYILSKDGLMLVTMGY